MNGRLFLPLAVKSISCRTKEGYSSKDANRFDRRLQLASLEFYHTVTVKRIRVDTGSSGVCSQGLMIVLGLHEIGSVALFRSLFLLTRLRHRLKIRTKP